MIKVKKSSLIVNKSLVLLLTMLSLISFTSTVKVNISEMEDYLMFDKKNGKFKIGDKFNFKIGEWYMNFNEMPGNDGRIAEFHTNFCLWVNSKFGEINNAELMYLESPKRVIIFYADRKPIVGPSMAIPMGMEKAVKDKNENFELNIESLGVNISDFLEMNHELPFMTMKAPYLTITSKLFEFPSLLSKVSDKTNYENLLNDYATDFSEEAKEKYEKDLSQMIADFLIMKNIDNLKDPSLRKESSDNMELRIKYGEFLYSNLSNVKTELDKFTDSLIYFVHKALRNFFFDEEGDFIKMLFSNVEIGNSNLENLVENNVRNEAYSILVDPSRLNQIKFEEIFDKNSVLIENQEDSNKSLEKKIQEYFFSKRFNVYKSFEELSLALSKNAFDGVEPFDFKYFCRTTIIDDLSNLTLFMDLFANSLLPEMFNTYINYVVYEKFATASYLKKFTTPDLSQEPSLMILRNYLMYMGFIDYNPDLDGPIAYRPFEVFNPVDDLLLLI